MKALLSIFFFVLFTLIISPASARECQTLADWNAGCTAATTVVPPAPAPAPPALKPATAAPTPIMASTPPAPVPAKPVPAQTAAASSDDGCTLTNYGLGQHVDAVQNCPAAGGMSARADDSPPAPVAAASYMPPRQGIRASADCYYHAGSDDGYCGPLGAPAPAGFQPIQPGDSYVSTSYGSRGQFQVRYYGADCGYDGCRWRDVTYYYGRYAPPPVPFYGRRTDCGDIPVLGCIVHDVLDVATSNVRWETDRAYYYHLRH
jgi:hypothetical protein